MASDRYVLMGLAHVRSPWFRDLARWANSAAIPAEFVKCVSAEEVRARLGSGRPFSALLIDGSLPAVDRDLIDTATDTGTSVFIIDDGRVERDWLALGATRVLAADLSRGELLDALENAARPVPRADALTLGPSAAEGPVASWSGELIAVTGAGGTGASVVAMAVAAALGTDPRYRQLVLLADLALDAEQAMLHDARDVVPGVQELVEAFRTGVPTSAEIRSLVFSTDRGEYHLLLGLRRHRDWAGLRPRAFEAAIERLLHSYRVVVADIDSEVEGEPQCGVIEVEDRNLLARTVARRAGVVGVVGTPGVKGLHSMVRVVSDLLEFGVAAERLLPVINRAPRSGRARAELTSTFAELLDGDRRGVASPIYVTERRRLDEALRDGIPLPLSMGQQVATAALALLGTREQPLLEAPEPEPELVAPGSLGSWADAEEADE